MTRTIPIAPFAQHVGLLCPSSPIRPHLAVTVRLAAFRLIEAGIEDKPSIECMHSLSQMSHIRTLSAPFPLALIHVLQLASKVGASLAGR